MVKPDKTWSFHVNGERVTYDQWVTICDDHKKWCEEQERKAAQLDEEPVKKRKKK